MGLFNHEESENNSPHVRVERRALYRPSGGERLQPELHRFRVPHLRGQVDRLFEGNSAHTRPPDNPPRQEHREPGAN